ncbi:FAD-dependent oxidoreductase [Micromonospora chokoriensis]|uniref:NAD(P)-binding Rossmann-like domain-containing protein n=1 Tax=Micromonospora chokoriensis TaxID=356851 RepID=A0A1C4XZH5_9ACTN|nr:FAD-dependent oxidoreductase [Micromonospora chokoriensis]SCF13873.1 NAD(P)-binding Rossmann-like domain-containing protein [Micromonospora chokoriensis]
MIVGGGIGGLSAALALHRHGWRVTVLERAAELREVGAGLGRTAEHGPLRGLETPGGLSRPLGTVVGASPGRARVSPGRQLTVGVPTLQGI